MAPNDSEQDLTARTRAGDSAAFAALVERHLGALHRLAAQLLPAAAVPQLLQDAVRSVHAGRRQLPASASLREELLVVTGQLALQRQPAATRGGRSAPPARSVAPRPQASVLAALPTEDRLAYLLVDVERLQDQAAARALAEPVAAVRRRAHVARLWLTMASLPAAGMPAHN
jgi:DNA-directed RNA polymerase specialized sigma24 family protein